MTVPYLPDGPVPRPKPVLPDLTFTDGRAEGEEYPGYCFIPCRECGAESSTVTAIYGSVEQTTDGTRYLIHRDPLHLRREPCGHLMILKAATP